MTRVFVFLGAPGSGKGTQCASLASKYGAAHVSLGALLRDQVERDTPTGRRVAADLAAGHLVPDDVALELVTETLVPCIDDRTVLLDGFPRTARQADLLEMRCPGVIAAGIELVVPSAVLLRRLHARGRGDDTVEAIRRRLHSYGLERQPLSAWFASRGLLILVDGNQQSDLVAASIDRALARLDVPSDRGVAGDHGRELRPGRHVELREHVLQVRPDCVRREIELFGDLPVRQALADELDDAELGRREAVPTRRRTGNGGARSAVHASGP